MTAQEHIKIVHDLSKTLKYGTTGILNPNRLTNLETYGNKHSCDPQNETESTSTEPLYRYDGYGFVRIND